MIQFSKLNDTIAQTCRESQQIIKQSKKKDDDGSKYNPVEQQLVGLFNLIFHN